MPYDSISELPERVRSAMSDACARVFREAHNDIEERNNNNLDEEEIVQRAYGAVQEACSRESEDDEYTRDEGREQNAAHERLANGAATLVGDAPADTYKARIVPIPEDSETIGLSGTPTVWPRETLKEATERGVWNEVKLIKSPGGTGHFEWGEQPPVENIAGRITESGYEEGVGPVLTAELVDDYLARLVENDLVSVSPDLTRELSEDEQLGTARATNIGEVRYITILDTAASANATIEPATAEALGVHPDEFGGEQLADGITVSDPQYSGTVEDNWSSPSLSDTYGGDIQDARDAALIVRDTDGELTFGDLSLFVVDGNGNLNLAALRAAKSRAPQTDGVSGDTLERVRTKINNLASDAFDTDFSDEQNAPGERGDAAPDYVTRDEYDHLKAQIESLAERQQRDGDESAESDTGATDTDTPMSDDTSNDELKEQFAAAQERADELEEQNEDLEREVEDKAERIEDLEAENEQYRDEAEFSRRQAAMIAAGGNEAVAETLVESERSGDDLAEMALASDHGAEVLGIAEDEPEEEPDDDQLSPRERLQDQLAESPAPRGGQGADNDPGDGGDGQLTDEQLAQANDRAVAAMSGNDIMKAQQEQLSGREFLRQHKNIDPVEYTSESALRNAVTNGNGGED